MSDKRYIVPEGMAQAAVEATCSTRLGMDEHNELIDKALEAALRWQDEKLIKLANEASGTSIEQTAFRCAIQAVRQMFLVQEIESLTRYGSCPACSQGQSLERGEGTHREGTVEHPADPEVPAPQERWTKHDVMEAIRRNYHYTDPGDGEIFITKILADLDPLSKPEGIKDGAVVFREGTTIPIGVWYKGDIVATTLTGIPEPEVSNDIDIQDLLWSDKYIMSSSPEITHDRQIREAYRRGKEAGK